MESVLIKEGFEFINKKNVFIKEYIADADSNTYKCLKLSIKGGTDIVKIDCANHMARNFRTHLENWNKVFKNSKDLNGKAGNNK